MKSGDTLTHFRMKREFGFFQQQRPVTILQGPQHPEKTKRTVREFTLLLPGSLLSPVFIFALKVRKTVFIAEKPYFGKPGRHCFQGFLNSTQTRISGPLRDASNDFEKIAPKWIITNFCEVLTIAYKLGYKVRVLN